MDRIDERLKAIVGIKRTNDLLEKSVKKDVRSYGLNISKFAVLELLYNKGPQPINRIQERILIANSSTTYVLDKLQKKEYIVRQKDENDKRRMIVLVTDKGDGQITE